MSLNQMDPLKALGPDKRALVFFQKYWAIVGCLDIDVMLQALNSSVIPPSFNHTHVVLVPKKKQPEVVGDFCPISVCNLIYKIISKASLTI